MTTEGYWAVCEEFTLPATTAKPSPSVCMISVMGFFYADVMAHSRPEAIQRVSEKLKDNIRFYLACGLDMPPLYTSNTVPKNYKSKENATLIFIPLKDLGLEYLIPELKAAA